MDEDSDGNPARAGPAKAVMPSDQEDHKPDVDALEETQAINISNDYKLFPGINQFLYKTVLEQMKLEPDTLLDMMNSFLKLLETYASQCYKQPHKAEKLRNVICNEIGLFYKKLQDYKMPYDPVIRKVMSALLTLYLDMTIVSSRSGNESFETIASKVMSAFCLYLEGDDVAILNTILKSKLINKRFESLWQLIFRRLLRMKQTPKSHEDLTSTYTVCHLAFKVYYSLISDMYMKDSIYKKAYSVLLPPPELDDLGSDDLENIPKISRFIKNLIMDTVDSEDERAKVQIPCYESKLLEEFHEIVDESKCSVNKKKIWNKIFMKNAQRFSSDKNNNEEEEKLEITNDSTDEATEKINIWELLIREVCSSRSDKTKRKPLNKLNTSKEEIPVVVIDDDEDDVTKKEELKIPSKYDDKGSFDESDDSSSDESFFDDISSPAMRYGMSDDETPPLRFLKKAEDEIQGLILSDDYSEQDMQDYKYKDFINEISTDKFNTCEQMVNKYSNDCYMFTNSFKFNKSNSGSDDDKSTDRYKYKTQEVKFNFSSTEKKGDIKTSDKQRENIFNKEDNIIDLLSEDSCDIPLSGYKANSFLVQPKSLDTTSQIDDDVQLKNKSPTDISTSIGAKGSSSILSKNCISHEMNIIEINDDSQQSEFHFVEQDKIDLLSKSNEISIITSQSESSLLVGVHDDSILTETSHCLSTEKTSIKTKPKFDALPFTASQNDGSHLVDKHDPILAKTSHNSVKKESEVSMLNEPFEIFSLPKNLILDEITDDFLKKEDLSCSPDVLNDSVSIPVNINSPPETHFQFKESKSKVINNDIDIEFTVPKLSCGLNQSENNPNQSKNIKEEAFIKETNPRLPVVQHSTIEVIQASPEEVNIGSIVNDIKEEDSSVSSRQSENNLLEDIPMPKLSSNDVETVIGEIQNSNSRQNILDFDWDSDVIDLPNSLLDSSIKTSDSVSNIKPKLSNFSNENNEMCISSSRNNDFPNSVVPSLPKESSPKGFVVPKDSKNIQISESNSPLAKLSSVKKLIGNRDISIRLVPINSDYNADTAPNTKQGQILTDSLNNENNYVCNAVYTKVNPSNNLETNVTSSTVINTELNNTVSADVFRDSTFSLYSNGNQCKSTSPVSLNNTGTPDINTSILNSHKFNDGQHKNVAVVREPLSPKHVKTIDRPYNPVVANTFVPTGKTSGRPLAPITFDNYISNNPLSIYPHSTSTEINSQHSLSYQSSKDNLNFHSNSPNGQNKIQHSANNSRYHDNIGLVNNSPSHPNPNILSPSIYSQANNNGSPIAINGLNIPSSNLINSFGKNLEPPSKVPISNYQKNPMINNSNNLSPKVNDGLQLNKKSILCPPSGTPLSGKESFENFTSRSKPKHTSGFDVNSLHLNSNAISHAGKSPVVQSDTFSFYNTTPGTPFTSPGTSFSIPGTSFTTPGTSLHNRSPYNQHELDTRVIQRYPQYPPVYASLENSTPYANPGSMTGSKVCFTRQNPDAHMSNKIFNNLNIFNNQEKSGSPRNNFYDSNTISDKKKMQKMGRGPSERSVHHNIYPNTASYPYANTQFDFYNINSLHSAENARMDAAYRLNTSDIQGNVVRLASEYESKQNSQNYSRQGSGEQFLNSPNASISHIRPTNYHNQTPLNYICKRSMDALGVCGCSPNYMNCPDKPLYPNNVFPVNQTGGMPNYLNTSQYHAGETVSKRSYNSCKSKTTRTSSTDKTIPRKKTNQKNKGPTASSNIVNSHGFNISNASNPSISNSFNMFNYFDNDSMNAIASMNVNNHCTNSNATNCHSLNNTKNRKRKSKTPEMENSSYISNDTNSQGSATILNSNSFEENTLTTNHNEQSNYASLNKKNPSHFPEGSRKNEEENNINTSSKESDISTVLQGKNILKNNSNECISAEPENYTIARVPTEIANVKLFELKFLPNNTISLSDSARTQNEEAMPPASPFNVLYEARTGRLYIQINDHTFFVEDALLYLSEIKNKFIKDYNKHDDKINKVCSTVTSFGPTNEKKNENLHETTLIKDHRIFISQKMFKTFHIDKSLIYLQTVLYRNSLETRCNCVRCGANNIILLANDHMLHELHVLTLVYKILEVNKNIIDKKSVESDNQNKMVSPTSDQGNEESSKDEGSTFLPLKKRTTLPTASKIRKLDCPSTSKNISYPADRMISIAQVCGDVTMSSSNEEMLSVLKKKILNNDQYIPPHIRFAKAHEENMRKQNAECSYEKGIQNERTLSSEEQIKSFDFLSMSADINLHSQTSQPSTSSYKPFDLNTFILPNNQPYKVIPEAVFPQNSNEHPNELSLLKCNSSDDTNTSMQSIKDNSTKGSKRKLSDSVERNLNKRVLRSME